MLAITAALAIRNVAVVDVVVEVFTSQVEEGRRAGEEEAVNE